MRAPMRLSLAISVCVSCGGERPRPMPAGPPLVATPVPTVPTASAEPDGGAKMPPTPIETAPTFADDLAFLKKHGAVHVLEASSGGRVALSAKYQGRVMTSAVAEGGRSCGWIHREFIASGKTGTQFDNFGGEDRLWLGPEGGQYGLYFPKGSPFTFDAWQVPHPMQEGAWDMPTATPSKAVFKRSMKLANWTGTSFDVDVERTVELVDPTALVKTLPKDVTAVAFQTVNKITNAGKDAWKKESGLVSVWILAMYAPAADGRAIVPFRTDAPKGTPIVNDAYFGKVPSDRLTVHEDKGFLTFVVDGKHRSKIGLGPKRAKNVLGSYSAEAKLLTIVQYEPAPAAAKPYVNSMWEKQKEPYGGDVVNSYNDGPPAPGKPPLGGFYELETSSPGAELAPKQSLVHTHRTFHFVGEREALEPIAKAVLGVSLGE
jgi:hypothetical protein